MRNIFPHTWNHNEKKKLIPRRQKIYKLRDQKYLPRNSNIRQYRYSSKLERQAQPALVVYTTLKI